MIFESRSKQSIIFLNITWIKSTEEVTKSCFIQYIIFFFVSGLLFFRPAKLWGPTPS
jgi:hypothetical protein